LISKKDSDLPLPISEKSGWPWKVEGREFPDKMKDGSSWPIVSIVTPSYNQGAFIEETIRSVLLQGYPNLEYWIMDGGSSDNTMEVLNKYDKWLTGWISEKDDGQADAINKGWEKSTGKLLGWINSDDVLLPNSIKTCVEFLDMNPEYCFVFGDLIKTDANGRFLSRLTYHDFDICDLVKEAGWISQQGNLFKRSLYQKIGKLDTSLNFQMDLDYWIRAGLVCKGGYINKPLAKFRQHDNSKTTSKIYLAADDILNIYKKIYDNPNIPTELVNIQREAWANAHIYAARVLCLSNLVGASWKELLVAIKIYPRSILSWGYLRLLIRLLFTCISGGNQSKIYKKVKQISFRFRKIKKVDCDAGKK